MYREMIHSTGRGSAEQVAWTVCTAATPTSETDFFVELGALRGREPEAGNACIGIAVGCVLSLPIWVCLMLAFYTLR